MSPRTSNILTIHEHWEHWPPGIRRIPQFLYVILFFVYVEWIEKYVKLSQKFDMSWNEGNGGHRPTLRHLLTSYRFQKIQLTLLTLRTSPRKFTEKITVGDAWFFIFYIYWVDITFIYIFTMLIKNIYIILKFITRDLSL